MKALILETSTEKSCLILAENGSVRKSKLLSGGPELSKKLAQEVDSLLEGTAGSIDFIAVGQGPGSYTGTRVGAALGRGLSFGWQVPLYGFCSLKAFAPREAKSFTIIVDARMGGLYILSGRREGSDFSFSAPQLMKLDEAAHFLEQAPFLVSPHPAEILRRLPQLKIEERDPNPDLLAKWAFLEPFQTPLELSYLSSP